MSNKSTNLIINSPYSAPSEHWQFVEEGEPLELAEGRRQARYMIADPKAKPHREKGICKPLLLANQIRQRVAAWCEVSHPRITSVTKTGELESDDANRIAAWMLDTDCDDRSLYTSQAFFSMAGSNDGWTKLAKNLRIEIDGGMIKAYERTQSLPFERGKNNRIAVKIVDDSGIESLQVVEIMEAKVR